MIRPKFRPNFTGRRARRIDAPAPPPSLTARAPRSAEVRAEFTVPLKAAALFTREIPDALWYTLVADGLLGPDWPVCTLAAEYDDVLALAGSATARLTPAEGAAVFGGTAGRVHGVGPPDGR
ncbi:hypothetical protein [Streptomyces gilvosporeus]|uniref:hypothetical protein n=1 Tax=Streptomyces gilvosporeus TaxID=553510 RepID=UPI0030017013